MGISNSKQSINISTTQKKNGDVNGKTSPQIPEKITMSGDMSDKIVASGDIATENASTSNIEAISAEESSATSGATNKCEDVEKDKTETEEMSEDSEHGGEKKRKSSWTKEKMKKKFSMRSLSFKKKRSAAKDSVNSSEDLTRPDTEGEELPKPETELKIEVTATGNVEESVSKNPSSKGDVTFPQGNFHPKAAEIIDIVPKVDKEVEVQSNDSTKVVEQDSAPESDQDQEVTVLPSKVEHADPESDQILLADVTPVPVNIKAVSDEVEIEAVCTENEEEIVSDEVKKGEKLLIERMTLEVVNDWLASVTLDAGVEFAEAVFKAEETVQGAEQEIESEKTKSSGRLEITEALSEKVDGDAEAVVHPEDNSQGELEKKD